MKAQTGKPSGRDWQTWSAAMYLYAAECAQQQCTPFVNEIRAGALAGTRFTPILFAPPPGALHVPLPGQQRQQGILPQLIVVVEIFVAQGDPVHALAHQFADAVLHPVGSTAVTETGGELTQDASALFNRA
jgi:hypothetical protein